MRITREGQVLEAFYRAKASVESVAKSELADMGKYEIRYASLNAVHAEVERACELHKLVVCQEPTVRDGLFAVVTTLLHEDCSMIEFEPMCLPLPKDAQALGSATTYLRRYSLVSQFGIAVEDDDGRAATVAAQAAPGRRTEAERMIRESIATMDEATRKRFVTDFKGKFGVALQDLPAAKHGEALTWSREWGAAGDVADQADAEWVEQAKEPV